jgi:hypothetical protein
LPAVLSSVKIYICKDPNSPTALITAITHNEKQNDEIPPPQVAVIIVPLKA